MDRISRRDEYETTNKTDTPVLNFCEGSLTHRHPDRKTDRFSLYTMHQVGLQTFHQKHHVNEININGKGSLVRCIFKSFLQKLD